MKHGIQLKQPINTWLHQQLKIHHLGELYSIILLTTNARFKTYRIHLAHGNSCILSQICHETNLSTLLNITNYWKQAGIRIPELLAVNLQDQLLLSTDPGKQTLLQQLYTLLSQAKPNYQLIKLHYEQAFKQLLQIQQLPQPKNFMLEDYTEERLINETLSFQSCLLEQWLGIQLSVTEHQELTSAIHWLAIKIREQPYVWTHRAYHADNLFLNSIKPGIAEELSITNYAHAIWGPLTYDLVSLLKGVDISWPEYLINELINSYMHLYQQTNRFLSFSENQFRNWCDATGLQQHLQMCGTLVQSYLNDQKVSHLSHIPRTLIHISRVANRYQQTYTLKELITNKALPLAVKKLNICSFQRF